jgi:hypothetical protein
MAQSLQRKGVFIVWLDIIQSGVDVHPNASIGEQMSCDTGFVKGKQFHAGYEEGSTTSAQVGRIQ